MAWAWAWAMHGMRVTWLALSWGWCLMKYLMAVMNAVLLLAGISANFMRLRAAYGDGGTGAPARRNWAALLLWKINHVLTRNRLVCSIAEGVNSRLERLLGAPAAPARGIHRQESFRGFHGGSSGSSNRSVGSVSSGWSSGVGRDWSPGSGGGVDPREDRDRAVLARIAEEYAGTGVDGGDWDIYGDSCRRTQRFTRGGHSSLNTRRYRYDWQPRPNLPAGDGTPQWRVGDEGEPYPPPELSRTGQGAHAGAGTGSPSGLGSVSLLPGLAAVADRSVGEAAVVRHKRRWFRRDATPAAGSRAEICTKEADDLSDGAGLERNSWGGAEGVVESGGLSSDAREIGVPLRGRSFGDLGEIPAPPCMRRSGSSESRITTYLRKSSVSRLALGLKKGEVTGRDGWLREVHHAQECYSCHRRFKPVTRPRHHCSRCHRVFCGRHGFTSHPPVTPCSVPGECICNACIDSESEGIRGPTSESGEDLDTRTFEFGSRASASMAASESSIRTGRRLSFGHLRRFLSVSGPTRVAQASTVSARTSAVVATAQVTRGSSDGTASTSEVSPTARPQEVPLGVSMEESRVGNGVGRDRGWARAALGVRQRVTR